MKSKLDLSSQNNCEGMIVKPYICRGMPGRCQALDIPKASWIVSIKVSDCRSSGDVSGNRPRGLWRRCSTLGTW